MATGISSNQDYTVTPTALSSKPHAPPPPVAASAPSAAAPTPEPDEMPYDPHTRNPNTSNLLIFFFIYFNLNRLFFIMFFVNQVVNQESDNKYVRLTMRIPGLKTKRQMNLQKVPVNGRVIEADYKKK